MANQNNKILAAAWFKNAEKAFESACQIKKFVLAKIDI